MLASVGRTFQGVLAGIRVLGMRDGREAARSHVSPSPSSLDFSRLFPGPWTTQILRDMVFESLCDGYLQGAEVIRVEQPTADGGDVTRTFEPLCNDGMSLLFHQTNRGKKSIAVDLKSPLERDRVLELASKCDVVIEQYRPGVMQKLGLDYSTISSKNPSVVYCSLTGYGQDGPLAQTAGHDLNYAARAGLYEGVDSPVPFQVAGIAGGALPAAINILGALFARQTSGKGCYIDLSITDGAYASMPSRVNVEGMHNTIHGNTPCYNMYETKDGMLSVGALEHKFFEKFLGIVGLTDPKHVGHLSYDDNADAMELHRTISKVMATKTTTEWMSLLHKADVCVSPVLPASTASFTDPQLKFRNVNVNVKLTSGDTVPLVKTPVYLKTCEPAAEPAPFVGQHNAEVFGGI